eukprot:1407301-Prymnesium_polylepis.1
MSPTIVLQDALVGNATQPSVRAVVGASGGPRIISATVQVLANALLRGAAPADAVGWPRLHHQFLPNVAFAEAFTMADGGRQEVPPTVVDGLRARAHDVRRWARHATTQL